MSRAKNAGADTNSHYKLTPSEHKFATEFVANGGDAVAAFKIAYSCRHLSNGQIMNRAGEILARETVYNYIKQLRTTVSSSAMFDVQEIFNELVNIATADVNEIVEIRRTCCRYCYGKDHKYQWINEDELDEARLAASAKKLEALPDERGGFGYDKRKLPDYDCPRCRGDGLRDVQVRPSLDMGPRGRRLFDGIKYNAAGLPEVRLRNRDEALKMLMRIMGVYAPPTMAAPPRLSYIKQADKMSSARLNVPTDPHSAAEFYSQFKEGTLEVHED